MEIPTHTLTARRPTTVHSLLVIKHDTDDTHSPLSAAQRHWLSAPSSSSLTLRCSWKCKNSYRSWTLTRNKNYFSTAFKTFRTHEIIEILFFFTTAKQGPHQFLTIYVSFRCLPHAVANLKFHINLQCRILMRIPLFMQCALQKSVHAIAKVLLLNVMSLCVYVL